MRAALCVSGDFLPSSQAIATACEQMLQTETVDVFAFLWAAPGTPEKTIHDWLTAQTNGRVRIKRWAVEPIRAMNEWTKFAQNHPKHTTEYFEQLSRIEWGLQAVCQLKCQQESAVHTDYDIVVHIDSQISLTAAPAAQLFSSILNDHIVLGRFDIMPWFPAHGYGVSITSTRNMEVYSSIQTMHRRQYLMRYNNVDISGASLKGVLTNHFHHAGLQTCSVIMTRTPP
ncbi:MAG: hypothetical protein JNM81_13060 [Rhodospirillaceae bacterium]|nr:hypothetical protein [Rhodospirillaceae bacterium]